MARSQAHDHGGLALPETARRLLDAGVVVTLATLNPDGGPQLSAVWVKRDGDALLFTTTTGRRKARNLARDPRVGVLIVDPQNPYATIEIRGVAQLIPDPERALSRELTRRYLGQDPPADPPGEERLIVRVSARRITEFSA